MQIHTLHRQTKFKRERRVGRGGKRGTYSGRGIKGQRARAGAKIRPAERDILKRIPKRRGYKFKTFQKKSAAVNLSAVERQFSAGDRVSPAALLQKGLIERVKGRLPAVKILGGGTLIKSLTFKDVAFSKKARNAMGANR